MKTPKGRLLSVLQSKRVQVPMDKSETITGYALPSNTIVE